MGALGQTCPPLIKPTWASQGIDAVTDQATLATLSNGLPPPPVPDGLQRMLAAYPHHIERLQQVLNSVVEHPASGVLPFERATWALEGRLETFISEAREELEKAEAKGDADEVAKAKKKELLMLHSRSWNCWDDENLREYFDRHGAAVRHGE